ncbi:MAG: dTDP-glucose 4,6-dehydratase [Candidatus Kerfeldbacteria bacterium]|nr:dTDP-glucose 4,6-dehydratase [Candidatus Kerfeldbacteria bacterium]
MKLLVTGGAGFIGSNFIHYWLKQHPTDSIVNLDLLTYAGNLANLAAVQDSPNYHFVQGDVCDPTVVNPLVYECDVVVHFAAESHVDRSIVEPGIFLKTNVLGTQVLLQAALEYSKRFHHISTDEVFGTLPLHATVKFNEDTPYQPRSPYSASKAASDHIVRAYHETYGLPITISNCTNNYGPWHFPEKFIPLAITKVMAGQPIPIYGQGVNVRDWLYVEDHCRAIELIVLNGKIGETYCVGGNSELDNLALAKLILKLMGASEELLSFVTDRPGHDLRYAMDYGKIQRELGWEPTVDITTGLRRTIDWFQAHRDWVEQCLH